MAAAYGRGYGGRLRPTPGKFRRTSRTLKARNGHDVGFTPLGSFKLTRGRGQVALTQIRDFPRQRRRGPFPANVCGEPASKKTAGGLDFHSHPDGWEKNLKKTKGAVTKYGARDSFIGRHGGCSFFRGPWAAGRGLTGQPNPKSPLSSALHAEKRAGGSVSRIVVRETTRPVATAETPKTGRGFSARPMKRPGFPAVACFVYWFRAKKERGDGGGRPRAVSARPLSAQ